MLLHTDLEGQKEGRGLDLRRATSCCGGAGGRTGQGHSAGPGIGLGRTICGVAGTAEWTQGKAQPHYERGAEMLVHCLRV